MQLVLELYVLEITGQANFKSSYQPKAGKWDMAATHSCRDPGTVAMSLSTATPHKDLIEEALLKPTVFDQCHHLTNALQVATMKDLASSYQKVIYCIFGFKEYAPGWGLDWMSSARQKRDFDAVRLFLGPSGPLFDAIYRLLAGTDTLFEFPITCLPNSTKRRLEDSSSAPPELYANKLHWYGQSISDCLVALDAFELYFFHFAYLMVRKEYKPTSGISWSETTEWAYAALLASYLDYFMPLKGLVPPFPYRPAGSCDGTSGVISRGSRNLSSPLSSNSVHRTPSSIPLQAKRSGIGHLGLLKHSSMLQRSLSTSQQSPQQSQQQPVSQQQQQLQQQQPTGQMQSQQQQMQSTSFEHSQPETEMWRTEKMLQIITEFWLNQVAYDLKSTHQMQDDFLPCQDLVFLVRITVKHLYYFSNSSALPWGERLAYADAGGIAGASSNYFPTDRCSGVTPLSLFKITFFERYMQRYLYAFLRNGFERWPLDTSFHIVLETWLTTIQPWRYVSNRSSVADEDDECPSIAWSAFIRNNYLFYSVLLQDVISRFSKIDLSSPKMIHMLYRVAKVFSRGCILRTLQEVDESLLLAHSPGYHPATPPSPRMALRHQQHVLQQNVALMLENQIAELESPSFSYCSLFGTEVRTQVYTLLSQTIDSIAALNAESRRRSEDGSRSYTNRPASSSGFLSWLGLSPLTEFNESTLRSCQDTSRFEMDTAELKKMREQLQYSATFFANAFGITLTTDFDQLCAEDHVLSSSVSSAVPSSPAGMPDHTLTDEGPVLTELGRWQLINGLRRFDIAYSGNPDLQPIRSYEVGSLVRLLYHISESVNKKFGHNFKSWCERPDVLGTAARRALLPKPPQQTLSPSCPRPAASGSQAKAKRQEPRLSLRFLGNYYFLVQLAVLFALFFFVFFGWQGVVCAALSLACGFVVVWLLFRPMGVCSSDES